MSLVAFVVCLSVVVLVCRNEHVPRECPDYVTGGPNSCYFDKTHTRVWEVYCMNVTARSSRGLFTSQEHCLDVADIGMLYVPNANPNVDIQINK